MPVVPRWVLTDVATSATWTMQRNPNHMTSPHGPRNTTIFSRSYGSSEASVARVLAFRQQPYEWAFGGDVRSEEMYLDLIEWTKKVGLLHVTDHFARTWEIRVTSLDLNEQKPTFRHPFRYEYTVKAVLYRQVS